jgi:ribosome-binding factor A
MAARRLDRVRELLKRELGEIIRRELPIEEVGVVTVNHVDVSPDLHSAAVFVSSVGSQEQRANFLQKLRKKTGLIQGKLAGSIVLKHSPRLRFLTDDSIQKGDRVLQILDELQPSDEFEEDDREDSDNPGH